MKNKTKNYAIEGSEESKRIYQIRVENNMAEYDKRFPPISYEYIGVGLDELATLSKKDNSAFDELYQRLNRWFKAYSFRVALDTHYDASDIYQLMLDTCKVAVRKYEITQGPFVHLLRKMLFFQIQRLRYNKTKRYLLDLKVFGRRIRLENESFLHECDKESENPQKYIIQKVDIEQFLTTYPSQDREIFQLFLSSYSIRTISKIVNLPYSTCKYRLYRMIDAYKKRIHPVSEEE